MFDLDIDVIGVVRDCLNKETVDEFTVPIVAWRVGGVTYEGKPWDENCKVKRLVIPSLKSTFNSVDAVVSTCEDITLQQLLKGLMDGDLSIIEMLSTPYIALNPVYISEFNKFVKLADSLLLKNTGIVLTRLLKKAQTCFECGEYDEVVRLEGVMDACLEGSPIMTWFTIKQEDYDLVAYLYDSRQERNRTEDDRQLGKDSLDRINESVIERGVEPTELDRLKELKQLFYDMLMGVFNAECYDYMENTGV